MTPLVSVIMPAHNAGRFIADAVNSVVAQTFSDWELLIIDDCSTDGTEEIAREFARKDPRIRLLRTERPGGGPAVPRNVGIENAAGRFIAFLDSDDIWLPVKLERQLPLFNVKNVAVVFSFYAKMSADGGYHSGKIESPAFVSFGELLNGNCIGNLTGIYDVRKCGKVFQKKIGHEDYAMWLEILRRGFFAMNTNTVEAVYRESKSSLSGSKLQAFRWHWYILRRELKLPFLKALKHFSRYAVRGILKFLK